MKSTKNTITSVTSAEESTKETEMTSTLETSKERRPMRCITLLLRHEVEDEEEEPSAPINSSYWPAFTAEKQLQLNSDIAGESTQKAVSTSQFSMMWRSSNGTKALMVWVPDEITEIEEEQTLLLLLADYLSDLTVFDDDPESAVFKAVKNLNEAGLIDQGLNKKALAKGRLREWCRLLNSPNMRALLSQQMEKDPFPLKPTEDKDKELWGRTLEEWTEEVLMLAKM